jgi:amidophosphoribosyltransferase
MGFDRRDAKNPQFTDHCFTGNYPTRLVDRDGSNGYQLSLLAEVS